MPLSTAETDQIVNGNGTMPNMLGMLNHTDTLTRTFPPSGETALDCIELAINDLRIGSAYTEPNLLAMNPGTFSMLRRQKDSCGRYLLEADPAADVAKTIWGKQVVTQHPHLRDEGDRDE